MQRIFSRFAVDVFTKNGRYYVRFDAGELAAIIKEIPITKEESDEIAQQKTVDEMGAYIMRFHGKRLKNARVVPPSEWVYSGPEGIGGQKNG